MSNLETKKSLNKMLALGIVAMGAATVIIWQWFVTIRELDNISMTIASYSLPQAENFRR